MVQLVPDLVSYDSGAGSMHWSVNYNDPNRVAVADHLELLGEKQKKQDKQLKLKKKADSSFMQKLMPSTKDVIQYVDEQQNRFH